MLSGMKRVVLVAVLVTACRSTGADDYPSRPSPGGSSAMSPGGSSGNVDAGVGDASDAGVVMAGRVCLVSDMRKLTACTTSGADGFTVTLGAPGAANPSKATTGNDGRFQIAAPLGNGFVWHVTGTGRVGSLAIEESVMAFGTENLIPAIGVEDYNAILETNHGTTLAANHGSVVVRVVNGVAPVANIDVIKVTPTPDLDLAAQYDSDDSLNWNDLETHANGVVWVTGIPTQPVTSTAPATPVIITLGQPLTAGIKATINTTVEDQAITFVTVPVTPTTP